METKNKDTKPNSPDTIRLGPAAKTQPDELDELIGAVINARYRIDRKLAQGGFGSVYLAVDQKVSSRQVVIKILRDEQTKKEWSVKKFQQEIEALARIDHPSIVGILDAGEMSNGKPYIVMQYVDGVSLRSLIKAEGMDFCQAANIIRQIGRALDAAHQRGILHRDLKPDNIMLQRLGADDDLVKIIDFGIAKVTNSQISVSTGQNRAVGTIAYMSPEQLMARHLTPASDTYSMGVIAYEMLTGRRPMNPDSAYQLLELQKSGVRVDPIDLRPSLPPGAQAMILKALAFVPSDRYERARDFGDLLAAALIGDEDQTLLQNQVKDIRKSSPDKSTEEVAETAHVLFMDIVGYSKLLIDQQTSHLRCLQETVRTTSASQRAHRDDKSIRIPTGDGMALVFFGEPESAVRAAVEISKALKDHPEIQLRMGVHSGLVYRVADINTNLNVAGGGINMAQRVMDCGDAGHILLSHRVADDLGQLASWAGHLHDLGETEVKHGVRLHIFNLYGESFGNAEVPTKLRRHVSQTSYVKIGIISAALAVALATVVALALPRLRGVVVTPSEPLSSESKNLGIPQSFLYWLTVQPMYNKKPLGPPLESSGDLLFGTGWKFRFNFVPDQPGALYVLNVGPGQDGQDEYNALFPTPGNNGGTAKLSAGQTMQSGLYDFVGKTGMEKLWIIWSTKPLDDLDSMFDGAARNRDNPGVIQDADQLRLQSYLKRFDAKNQDATIDESKKHTLVKGHGEVLIRLVELRHHGY